MCGVFGIISSALSVEEITSQLEAMGYIQRHRGPDDRRNTVFSYLEKHVGLGFVRLSILDLETGMQPICCEQDDTVILCNGQIYNYIELKEKVKHEPFVSKGDIEVALHLYRSFGIDFLNDLNGMFAGVIYDPRHHRFFLFRDRFGIKPLYYTIYQNNFIFSSEIKPLIDGCHVEKEINERRLAAFFTYRYVPGGDTLFKGIHRIPPGSYLEYDLNTDEYWINRYWNYRLDCVNPDITINEASEQFHALFTDAVKIRLRSDVEVGSFISGGIDSSAVSAQAARHQPDIRLFSIGFKEDKYNELPHVTSFLANNRSTFKSAKFNRQFCHKSHFNKLAEIVRSTEEPISLGTLIPTDVVCELASRQVKVVLTGEGADEIFGGYRKFMIEGAASQFNRLTACKQKELIDFYPELLSYLKHRDMDPAKRYIQNETLFNSGEIRLLLGQKQHIELYPEDARPLLTGQEDPVNAAIAFESRYRLPDYVILRLDRLSMRHSLEARTPLLDYRLAEFAATLPVNFKVNIESNREKYICSFSYLHHGIIDTGTAYRRKQPFTIPMADWLSDPGTLPDSLQDILLGDVIAQQGIIDPDYAKALVKKVTAEGIGPETMVSAADRVFAIIIFTLWYQIFFS